MPTIRCLRPVSAALAAALLGGCALTPFAPTDVQPGDARADVLRIMGPPTASYVMPDGHERLEYNRMPFGRKTYMIDLDAGGHVARWEQVLDEAHFSQVAPGLRPAEVLRLIGPPSWTGRYRFPEPGITWFYRYESVPRCQVFEVAFDAADPHVVSSAFPADPGCPDEWI